MANLTAANAERLARALDKRYLGGSVLGYNVNELVDEDRIAYVRLSPEGKWGFVLKQRISAPYLDLNALYYLPYFDAPKIVADYLMGTCGIPAFKAVNNSGVRSVEMLYLFDD